MQFKELHKNHNFSLVKAEMASDIPNKGSVHTNATSNLGIVTNNMILGNSNRSGANKRLRSASLTTKPRVRCLIEVKRAGMEINDSK